MAPMRGSKTESVKDPYKSTEEIYQRALKAGDEIIAAALRGEYAPDAGVSADA